MSVNKYKMIIVDLDDSLLNDQRELSEVNMEYLKKASEMGIEIVLASGRSDVSMLPYINQLKAEISIHYFVAYNGAMIIDLAKNSKQIEIIQQPILNDLIKLGKEKNVTVQLYNDNKLISDNYSERIQNYEVLSMMKAHIVDNIFELDYSVKILYNSLDIDKLNDLKLQIEAKYSSDVNCFFSKKTYLEILNIKADKGLAMLEIAKQMDIRTDEIIAIGDSYNDLYMLEKAGLGITPANSELNINNINKYKSNSNNNQNIMKEIVEKFILSNT